jgi:exopolysaccharide production protein ExoQ
MQPLEERDSSMVAKMSACLITDRSEDTEVGVELLVRTYVIVAILMFFAMGGYLPGPSARGQGAALASSADTVLGQMYQLVVWVIAIVLMAKCYRGVLKLCWEMKAMMGLSLLAPISYLWSNNPATSLRRGVFLVLGTMFAFYLVKRFSARQLAEVVVIAGIIAGVVGILTSILVPSIGRDSFNGGAWQGIFRSKNGCGNVMLSLLTAAMSFHFPRRGMEAARYLLFPLAIVLLVMSDAKTAWVLGALYMLAMYIAERLQRVHRRDSSIAKVLLLVLAGSLVAAIPIFLPTLLDMLGKDASLSGRVPLWASAFVSILKRPLLGYGYAAFWTGLQGESLNIFLSTHFLIYQAQNGLLEVWLELGLVGVVLVIVTFVSALRSAAICFRHGNAEAARWYVGMIVLTVIYNVDETCFATAHSLSWLLYVVGCAGLWEEAKKARAERRVFAMSRDRGRAMTAGSGSTLMDYL